MLFRGNVDVLHRVVRAADFDGAFITPPNHSLIGVLISKTLLRSFEKFVLVDACSHTYDCMRGFPSRAGLVIRRHEWTQ